MTSDFSGDTGLLVLRKEFDSPLEDEIKFKRIEEMKQIEANLMSFDRSPKQARRACRQLLTELLAQEIAQAIRLPGGSYELVGPSLSLEDLRPGLHSAAGADDRAAGPGGREGVRHAEPASSCARWPPRRTPCWAPRRTVWPVRWVLELADAKVEETGQRMFHDTVGDLSLPASIAQRLGSDGPLTLALPQRASALLGSAPSSILAGLQRSMVKEVRHARVHIRSEIHSRLVFGMGCLPMILIGIGWGILRREGHLLSAFGASCIPATILGVAILSGKQVAERVDTMLMPGILIMWSGLGLPAGADRPDLSPAVTLLIGMMEYWSEGVLGAVDAILPSFPCSNIPGFQ